MSDLIIQIKELIKSKPKHFSVLIKKDLKLAEFVEQHCTNPYNTVYAAKVYTAITGEKEECKYGNTKKFNSINDGFRFCGTASSCKCCKESVSNNLVQLKKIENKEISKKKREKTNLKKYGVSNTGQSAIALQNHAKFYENKQNVDKVTSKIKHTKSVKYGNKNFNGNKWYSKISEKLKENNLSFTIQEHEYKGMAETYCIKCGTCNNTFMSKVRYSSIPTCAICMPELTVCNSTQEQELFNFIRQHYSGEIITGSRKILDSGKSLDIYLPEKNLAIEYNELYWHVIDNDRLPHITKTYHYDKYIGCKEKGISLITIYGHLYNSKKTIIENRLLHKLGYTQETVYARKCIIKDVPSAEEKEFLNKTHIQGYVPSSIKYGLYFNDVLVALMSFIKSSNRNISGNNRYDYELLRYATSCSVLGGASKLFSHFVKNNIPNSIVSYSQNEWNTGNVYRILGFKQEPKINIGYWYVSPDFCKVYHRTNYTKKKLIEHGFNSNKSEHQIMEVRGFRRLYDCGNTKWVWENKI
ncbi:putative Hef-like homing endonuclease [Pseudomonas phage vB_Pa-PAC2]